LSAADLSDADLDPDILLDIARSAANDVRARLFACEILLSRDARTFLPQIGAHNAAAIYAVALQQNAGGELNPWAFLGMGDMGPFGKHLVACGAAAVGPLVPLLDDDRPAGLYSGSKESKLGNSDSPRICDFAAFFLAAILGLPYEFHRDFAMRDAQVAQIKDAPALHQRPSVPT
jgi:hypothetical protein